MDIQSPNPKSSSPVEVGLGIVLRRTPNENQKSIQIITRTNSCQIGEYEILTTKRPRHTVYGGYWELPGGKCEAGENSEDCVRRELCEEVGVEIELLTPLIERVHSYDHATVRLHPWVCRLAADSPVPRPLQVDDVRWERLDRVSHDEFPEANEAVIQDLITLIGVGGLSLEGPARGAGV